MMNLIGVLLPPLIDLVNKHFKDSTVKFWISVVICAVVGIGINWLQTAFKFMSSMEAADSIAASILATFGTAQLVYKAVYEDSKMQDTIRGE